MTAPVYLDAFAVGQVFTSGSYRMEKDAVIAFAREFDPQPAHTDEDAARSTQFGRLVASGWHTSAVTMRLMINEALPPIAGGGIGTGVERIIWPIPVAPGDVLQVSVEITSARASKSRPEKGLVGVAVTTTNQEGAVVMRMATTMVVLTRP